MSARIEKQLVCVITFLVFSISSFVPSSSHAGVMLTIQQQGSADLNALAIGQMVTFDVLLKELGTGESLDYLAATVGFDGNLLGTPSILLEGVIVPDVSGLLLSSATGIADGNYDVLFAATGSPIVANGVFFSFTVEALAAGSGVLDFSFLDAQDSAGSVLFTADVPLSFNIVTATVPEPTSWLILFVSASAICLNRKSRD